MSDHFAWRSIQRAPGFDDAAFEIFGDAQRADDALAGVEVALARNPIGESFDVPGSDPPLRAIKTPGSRRWPAVIVFFVHDAQFAKMIGIVETLLTED